MIQRGRFLLAAVDWRVIAVVCLIAGSGLTVLLSAPTYALLGGVWLVAMLLQRRFARLIDRPLVLWAALTAVAPLAAGGFLPPLVAALFAIPPLVLADSALEQRMASGARVNRAAGLTSVVQRLAVLWISDALLGVALGLPALILAGVLATLWLGLLVGRAWWHLRRTEVSAGAQVVRVVAGTPTRFAVTLRGDQLVDAILQVSCDTRWVTVQPQTFCKTSEVTLQLTVTAEHEAAPLGVELQLILWDRRMLVFRTLRPSVANVVVIPRVRYAEWLARSFLKGDRSVNVVSSIETLVSTVQGSYRELYQFHRPYQPGDPTRDIDWKRLRADGRLTVREFRTASTQQVLLCVGLATGNAMEADRLALDLVMAAVTLARTGGNVSIMCYSTPDRPAEVTGELSGDAVVRHALTHLAQITTTGGPERLLEPPNPAWLERVARGAASPVVQRLAAQEGAFIKECAAEHPLFQVLEPRLRRQQAGGSVILLSSLRDDTEAVAVLRAQAERHGTVMRIFRPGDLWTARTVQSLEGVSNHARQSSTMPQRI